MHRTSDLVCSECLFFDRGGDVVLEFGDAIDELFVTRDRRQRGRRGVLDRVDTATDVFSGFRGLPSELLHLSSDHGETLACFSSPGRFDRRVQREEVRLFSDRSDHLDDVTDLG